MNGAVCNMTRTSNTKTLGILTGVMAVLYVLFRVYNLLRVLDYATGLTWFYFIGYLLGFALIAVAAFTDRRDIIAPVGFAVLALVLLVGLFVNFYAPNLLDLIAFLSAAFIALLLLTELVPSAKEICRKIWFIPFVLLLVSFVWEYFHYIDINDLRDSFVSPIEYTFWFLRGTWGTYLFSRLTVLSAGLWASQAAAPVKAAAYPGYGAAPVNAWGGAPNYGQSAPSYGHPTPSYGQQAQYGQRMPQYGQPTPQYGQQMPQYGQPTPQYGQPMPQYGQPTPQYGQPMPQYGQPMPQYGQSMPQYGQPMPQYGQSMPQYGQPTPQYGQPTPQHPAEPSVQQPVEAVAEDLPRDPLEE